jgi:glycerol dehydrogenase
MAFENTGCALAHALHNGLKRTDEIGGEHGEIVAYCTLVQMAYERRPDDEIATVARWCREVGLPTDLERLGMPSKAALKKAVEYACDKDPDSRNMPDKMRPKELLEAVSRVEQGF